MTGTIMTFDDRRASGSISAEDGLRVRFDSSAVLAYDAASLAVGQSVTFDVVRGSNPRASNVSVERLHVRRPGAESRENAPPRYMGFEQSGNTRLYRFERNLAGHARTSVTVNADMSLFTKHRVGIQEGPALCLALLTTALDGTEIAVTPPPTYALADREMLAYLADRPVKHSRGRLGTFPSVLPVLAHAGSV
jgi:cold shock CspA family protein